MSLTERVMEVVLAHTQGAQYMHEPDRRELAQALDRVLKPESPLPFPPPRFTVSLRLDSLGTTFHQSIMAHAENVGAQIEATLKEIDVDALIREEVTKMTRETIRRSVEAKAREIVFARADELAKRVNKAMGERD